MKVCNYELKVSINLKYLFLLCHSSVVGQERSGGVNIIGWVGRGWKLLGWKRGWKLLNSEQATIWRESHWLDFHDHRTTKTRSKQAEKLISRIRQISNPNNSTPLSKMMEGSDQDDSSSLATTSANGEFMLLVLSSQWSPACGVGHWSTFSA